MPLMSREQKLTLWLLVAISVFLFAGQNVMNPVVAEIKQEYRCNEEDVGLVASAYTIIGAILSLVIGYAGDRYSRIRLFVMMVMLGEIPCLLNGFEFFTPTYQSLLWLRIISGIGLAGIFPITFSLIGDFFDSCHRATVIALVTTGWGIGQLLGQILAGFTANSLGWRMPFLLSALPNFVLVPLFLAFAKEPQRGAKEQELSQQISQGMEYQQKVNWADFINVASSKTTWLVLIQGFFGSVPWGVLPLFLIPFYEEQGLSKEFGTLITMVLGIGLTIGGLFGGWLGDVLYRRRPSYLPIFCSIAIFIGIIPLYWVLTLPTTMQPNDSKIWLLLLTTVTGLIIGLPSGNIKAILLNVNAPEHRGTVFGIHNITDSLGRGLGPWFGGMLIVNYGYWQALLIAVSLWVPCALFYGGTAITIGKDLTKLHHYLEQKSQLLAKRAG